MTAATSQSGRKLPRVGRRMVKSAVGAGLCLIIYLLRGQQGMVFYSMIALLQCMQPDIDGTLKMAGKRMTGTIYGAAFGLFVVLIRYVWFPELFGNLLLYYLLVSVMIIPVLYGTVLMHRENASYFSAVVFLCITVSHIEDTDLLVYVFNRVLDTFIGIAVSIPVNMFRIPRRKRKDTLFVMDADAALLDKESKLTPYSRFELRHMLQDGAQLSVSTMRTPASFMEVLGDFKWPLPIIVMDGAALYDMKNRTYVDIVSMSAERVRRLRAFFAQRGMNCFANTLIDGVLLICYTELKDEAEKQLIHDRSRSPYRNFVRTDLTEEGQVLYIMAVDKTEKIRQAAEDMRSLSCYNELKICVYESDDYPGNSYIKIYDRSATREHMTARLKDLTGLKKTVIIATDQAPGERYGMLTVPAFGVQESASPSGTAGIAGSSDSGEISDRILTASEYDLSRPDIIVDLYDGDRAVRALERVYEPYFWEKRRKGPVEEAT